MGSSDWHASQLSELQPWSVSELLSRVLLPRSNKGVIFTRADRLDINNLADLKDKIIAALTISNFANALVQFYVMHQAGQDYIMDPKQVIFTGTQVPTRVELESMYSCIDG
jgi:hypothetical protein